VLKNILTRGEKGSSPEIVAEAVFKAATDNRTKMRYRMGKSTGIVTLRRILPFGLYTGIMRGAMEK
jgi:hypothetical protein